MRPLWDGLSGIVDPVFELSLVFSRIKVALRFGDEAVCADAPPFEATNPDPLAGAALAGICALEGPVKDSSFAVRRRRLLIAARTCDFDAAEACGIS